jgi:prepilin-type N-terminal cleavage/methylation domain-containing protein
MMKNKKAFTLVEVILAVAIFAAVALPLLTVYVQSFKVDTAARGVLNANYISQQYIEKLDAATYPEALSDLPDRQAQGGYYLSAVITPHGAGGGAFVHLVALNDGKMLAVLPDGNWRLFGSVPSNISVSFSGSQYGLTCDGTSLTGAANASSCTVVFNAVNLASISPNVSLSGCKAVVYCTSDNESNINIVSGEADKYPDMFDGVTSLVHVTASVCDTADASEPVAQSEAYINIRNWAE